MMSHTIRIIIEKVKLKHCSVLYETPCNFSIFFTFQSPLMSALYTTTKIEHDLSTKFCFN